MAFDGRFRVRQEDYFPHGLYVTSEVEVVKDFDKSSRENTVQALDKESGVRLWEATVQDGDPRAPKQMRSFQVKFVAEHQPVPPEALPGTPFRPVYLEGMEVRPYVKEGMNGRSSIAYSVRATGMRAPQASAPSSSGSDSTRRAKSAAEAA